MTKTRRSAAGRPRRVSDERIFEAVAAIINEHGPSGLTLKKVAARLDITGPALGYRFENKRGLLEAFAAHQPAVTRQYLDRIAASSSSPADAIVEALVGLAGSMATPVEVANNIAMLHLDLIDDQLRQYAAVQARGIRSFIVEMLERAGFRDEEARLRVADELYVTWSGAIVSWAIDGRGALADWISERLRRILERALEPE